jgi:hypothetical protein
MGVSIVYRGEGLKKRATKMLKIRVVLDCFPGGGFFSGYLNDVRG